MQIPTELLQSQEVSSSGKLLWMFCERMQHCTGDIVRLTAKEIALQIGIERATVVKQAQVMQSLGWMNLIESKTFNKLSVYHYEAVVKGETND